MPNVNCVHISGHLGDKPELRFTGNQNPVANYSVATNHTTGKGDKAKTHTEWHKVVTWGSMAKMVSEWEKGDPVTVIGRLQTRSWEDKDGKKRYTTEIVSDMVVAEGKGSPSKEQEEARPTAPTISPDNLPF